MTNGNYITQDLSERIAKQFYKTRKISYLKQFVFGGIDGIITTFAVISGVIGGNLSAVVIVILGIAKLVADGFSMGASNFLGTKTENDERKYLKYMEYKQIKNLPWEEIEGLKKIFKEKGFEGRDLDKVVTQITSSPKLWLDTIMQEEHGIGLIKRSPWKDGLVGFIAFILCGCIPLIPFYLDVKGQHAFYLSYLLSSIGFFSIGAIKSIWSIDKWFKSGMITFFIGSLVAALAYSIAYYTKSLHLYF